MIRLFSATDLEYTSSNGLKVIRALKCSITKGDITKEEYYVDLEVPINYVKDMTQGKIVAIDTPYGIQAFRLNNPKKKSGRLIFKAYHVAFDAKDYTLVDTEPTNKNGQGALEWLISHTDTSINPTNIPPYSGKNLIKNTYAPTWYLNGQGANENYAPLILTNGKIIVKGDKRVNTWYTGLANFFTQDIRTLAQAGNKFTASIDVRTTNLNKDGLYMAFDFRLPLARGYGKIKGNMNGLWQRVEMRFNVTYNITSGYQSTLILISSADGVTWSTGYNDVEIEYRNLKLETGSNSTEYTQAPEDVPADKIFTAYSDIIDTHTTRYVRKSLFESIVEMATTYGGVLDADNHCLKMLSSIGSDKGITVEYGKNIESIEATEDWSDVVTKLLPVGYNGITIDGTWLVSEVQYDKPYTKVVEFSASEDVDIENEDLIREDLLAQATKYLNIHKYPKISYTTKAYLNNNIDIGDTIEVKHIPLGISIMTEVVQSVWNALTNSYDSITFGNYKENVKTIISGITASIKEVKNTNSKRYKVLKSAINESKNLVNRYLFEGHRFETDNATYYINTDDIDTATQFLIISMGGIGFGSKNIGDDITQAEYTTLWDIAGNFNANCITAGKLNFNYCEGGTLKLGGVNNGNGQLEIYDENNELVCSGGNNGFSILKGKINISSSQDEHNQIKLESDTKKLEIGSYGLEVSQSNIDAFVAILPTGLEIVNKDRNIGLGHFTKDGIYTRKNICILNVFEVNDNEAYNQVEIKVSRSVANFQGYSFNFRNVDNSDWSTVQAGIFSTPSTNIEDYATYHSLLRNKLGGTIQLWTNQSVQVRNGNNTAWMPVQASGFQQNSTEDQKTNIIEVTSSLDIIKNATIYKYNRIFDLERGINNLEYGFVIGNGYNTPQEVLTDSRDSINLYSMSSILWKATQEIYKKVDENEKRINELESKLATLEELIKKVD